MPAVYAGVPAGVPIAAEARPPCSYASPASSKLTA